LTLLAEVTGCKLERNVLRPMRRNVDSYVTSFSLILKNYNFDSLAL